MMTSSKKKHSSLEAKENEVQLVRYSMTEQDTTYQHQLVELSSALQQKEKEVQALQQSLQKEEMISMSSQMSWIQSVLLPIHQHVVAPISSAIRSLVGTEGHSSRLSEMDQHYKQHLYNTSVALEQKEREVEYLKSRMSEMEVYYRGKVAEGKAALAKKDEELKSFKDRVAGDVAVSIKTGKPESMEYPASRTRLRELYDDLRLQWPTIKSRLKAQKETPESLKALIQKIFSAAFENMEQQKSQIDKLFGLIERSSGPVPQKVYEYKQLTIQCLQLTLYQKRLDEAGSKTPFIQYDHKSCTDVMDFLVSHCHWLACLMALNNPPLKPDWDHHDPGMDTWDILPRNIRASTAM